jgi:CCR4-NOT transcription complex subunit 1
MEVFYKSKGVDLRMIITKALDDSIQEIVEPVIDRAVKIAIVTAKQLILKDFALESNPERFKSSFGTVVKKLAGPLAQVTCREPLKASMNRTLKNYLNQSLPDMTEVETIITKVIPDNLDLGCALIKKAVIESAEEAIRKDEVINNSITDRNTAFSQNKQFRDESFLREIPAIVPEELRPKVGGLTL